MLTNEHLQCSDIIRNKKETGIFLTGHVNNATGLPDEGPDEHTRNELSVMIKACMDGDPTAQKQLYEKYSPLVFGIIKRYVKHIEPAEEILNDAFYSCFNNLHQFSFKGPFEGWIYRITVNAVAYHYKRNTRHKDVVYKEHINEEVTVASNALQDISYKELLELVYQIPDTQRAVFNLFVFERYTHKEIAEVLNITDTTSRWYLNDARKRLKKLIKERMDQ